MVETEVDRLNICAAGGMKLRRIGNRVSQKIEKFYMEEYYPLYLSVMDTESPQKISDFYDAN